MAKKTTHLKLDKEFHKALYTLKDKMKDKEFATNVYRALCNMQWKKLGTDFLYSCSWRFAGGLVAEIRNVGEDYMTFYCSGDEDIVPEEIEKLLNDLEWVAVPWEDD